MQNYYETKRVLWITSDRHFFPQKNAEKFSVYGLDGFIGRVVCATARGFTGWVVPDREGIYQNRAAAVAALVGEDTPERPRREIIDDMSSKIIYGREIVLVQPNPLKAVRFSLDDGGSPEGVSCWTSVAAAIVQTNPSGKQHAVVCEDAPDGPFQPAEYAREAGLLPPSCTHLPSEQFGLLISAFTASMSNLDNIRALACLIDELAPSLRFIPSHLIPVLQDGDRYLGKIFLHHCFDGYEALVNFSAIHDRPKDKFIGELGMTDDDADYLVAGWFAFRSLERAVEMKIRAPADVPVRVHALSKDAL